MFSKARILLVGLACLILSSFLLACGPRYGHHYGHDRGYYYNQERQAYDVGFREGYEHGLSDRRRGHDFNYSHDSKYRYGISDNRNVNSRFRQGYVRGYESGYYGRRY